MGPKKRLPELCPELQQPSYSYARISPVIRSFNKRRIISASGLRRNRTLDILPWSHVTTRMKLLSFRARPAAPTIAAAMNRSFGVCTRKRWPSFGGKSPIPGDDSRVWPLVASPRSPLPGPAQFCKYKKKQMTRRMRRLTVRLVRDVRFRGFRDANKTCQQVLAIPGSTC